MFRRFYAFYVTWRFLQCWMSARVAMLLTLRLSTSTFLSREMTETSESSAPQQLSFLTWFMSLTLVLATIMSSLNFTMVTSHSPATHTSSTSVTRGRMVTTILQ